MRWKSEKRENKPRPQTFLVLPLVDNNRDVMTKSPSLRLHLTNAWQANEDLNKESINESDIIQRPLTATLEKPEILDIRFIDKLDMSKIRKEFLTFTNLGINNAGINRPLSTITISNSSKRDDNKSITKKQTINKRSICSSRLSQLATPRQTNPINNQTNNNQQASTISDDSWEDDSSTSLPQSARKSVLRSRVIPPKRRLPRKPITVVPDNVSGNDELNNNNNSSNKSKQTTIGMIRKNKILSIDNTMQSIKALPEPCTTCGRPDQPERFHSHPIATIKGCNVGASGLDKQLNDVSVVKVPVKNTVQKPTAIKYKSKLTPQKPTNTNNLTSNSVSDRISSRNVRIERKMSLPQQQLIHTPPGHNPTAGNASGDAKVRSSRGPRTLTCYLCGREFGTASLPLHEPKCLERLQRENATLPEQFKRKFPIKPKSPLTQQEWNKFAWEASQQLLTPCHCGRTFHPDRLIVHQRSCKENAPTVQVKSPSGIGSIKLMPPPSVQCKICGKLFGTKSIKYHEPQCIKKYQAVNGKLPSPPRIVSPTEKDNTLSKVSSPNNARAITKDDGSMDRPSSGKKPPMFPCYLCGRLFSVNSIYIHEPQCLKKWRAENDQLPPGKRRTVPLKPDIRFTPSGNVNFKETFNRIWDNHLAELVPCKRCGRTFFPDRIAQHEQGCNAEPRRNAK